MPKNNHSQNIVYWWMLYIGSYASLAIVLCGVILMIFISLASFTITPHNIEKGEGYCENNGGVKSYTWRLRHGNYVTCNNDGTFIIDKINEK